VTKREQKIRKSGTLNKKNSTGRRGQLRDWEKATEGKLTIGVDAGQKAGKRRNANKNCLRGERRMCTLGKRGTLKKPT